MTIPPYPQDSLSGRTPGSLACPKCHGEMRTYDRNGVHLEQCGNCRGVFLDFGELESLIQLESRFAQAPPSYGAYGAPGAPTGPGWGNYQGRRYHKRGLASLFFSS